MERFPFDDRDSAVSGMANERTRIFDIDPGPWNPVHLASRTNAFIEPPAVDTQSHSLPPKFRSDKAPKAFSDSGYTTGNPISPSSSTNRPRHNKAKARTQSVSHRPTNSVHRTKDKQHINQKCPHCGVILKTRSEIKKHESKHDRPHKCNYQGCTKGFATPNDLDRHQRCKHKLFPANAKVWKCAAPDCSENEKEWPRLDNFRQHLERMHKDLEPKELIKASERNKSRPDTADPPAFMDAQGEPDDLLGPHDDESGVSFTGRNTQEEEASNYTEPHDVRSNSDYYGDHFNRAWLPMPSTTGTDEHSETGGQAEWHQQSRPSLTPLSSYDAHYGGLNSPNQGTAPRRWSEAPSRPMMGSIDMEQRNLLFSNMTNLDSDATTSNWHQTSDPSLMFSPPPAESTGRPRLPSHHDTSSARQAFGGLLGSNFPKNSHAEPYAPRSGNHTSPTSGRPLLESNVLTCGDCGKVFPRPCDLKKHSRRHTRPYGCTFDNCVMQFGSKNDWKRHESSQHEQEEVWRCRQPQIAMQKFSNGTDTDAQCGFVSSSNEEFQSHLQVHHGMKSTARIREISQTCRIGANFQHTYWCGFCRKILQHKKEDLEAVDAVDERYNHIAKHFVPPNDNPGSHINNWTRLQDGRTKGEARNDQDTPLNVIKDENDIKHDGSPTSNYTTAQTTQPGYGEIYVPQQNSATGSHIFQSYSWDPYQNPKADGPATRVQIRCCMCSHHYEAATTNVYCASCRHGFCVRCTSNKSSIGSVPSKPLHLGL